MKIIIKDLNFNGLSCSLKLFTRWRRAGWRFLVWKVAEDHWMLVSSNWRFVLIVRWRWMQVLGLELHTNFNYVKTELDRKAAPLPCSLLLLKEWHQLIKWVKQKNYSMRSTAEFLSLLHSGHTSFWPIQKLHEQRGSVFLYCYNLYNCKKEHSL